MRRARQRWVVRSLGAGILACLLSPACAANLDAPGSSLTVRGRVVDAETCASVAGCRPLAGMIVSLASAPDRVRSAPTGSDGTFVLAGVPIGYRHDFIVRAEGGSALVAPTLNPMVIEPSDRADRYGVELAALPRDRESLVEGLRAEGLDLALSGGYVGQVVRITGPNVTAADGVRVQVFPSQRSLRFVRVLPRFVSGEPALFPPDATVTGAFGLFVIEADGPEDPVAIAPSDDATEYDLVVAPLAPGIVTYAIHRGEAP